MGLDNGIQVRFKKKNDKNRRLISISDVDKRGGDMYEIFYWRKCWGIRNTILGILGAENDDGEYIISKEQMIEIYEAHWRWLDEDTWNAEASSIWTYEEIVNTLSNDVCNMLEMINNWDDLEIDKVIFYDSY